jgi:iron complex transport system ATP-binding protein
MKQGRIVAEGTPGRIVTWALVSDVFGLSCRVIPDPVSESPMVVPLGRQVVKLRR